VLAGQNAAIGQTLIEYGATIYGAIGVPAEVDSFAFAGNPGDIITLRLAGTWVTSPRLELLSPGGTLLKNLTGQAVRVDTLPLSAAGNYIIRVSDDNNVDTGSYSLHLQRIVGPAGATSIVYGQTLQDSVVLRAEIRAYTFSGTTGEIISALLATTWNNVSRLELYDPAGTLRRRVDGQTVRIDTLRLTSTGTYTVFVLDNDGLQTGTFGLHLERVVDPVGATPLVFGQTVQDSLIARTDMNTYTFTGSAGEVITAFLAGSWNNVPRLELYDPAGALRKRIDGQSIRADTVHLSGAGTYTLLILDSDGQQTGNYGLHLQRITTPAGATPIGYGQTLQDTVTVRAEMNAYTFSGTAGEVVTVQVAGNWSNVPRLEVYDPAGNLRKRFDAQSIRADTVHLPQSGAYTLLVLDSDGQQTGNYGLHLQRITAPAGATSIAYGQTLQDTVSARAEINAYIFTGIAGEVITAFASGNWSTVPRLELYDPAGNLRKRLDGQSIRADTVHLPQNGIYTLFVLDNDGQQTGNYGLHIQRITDPVGSRAMSYGQTLQDTLTARSEINAYAFSGTAGEVVTAMLAGTWNPVPRLEIYDPAGGLRKRLDGQSARADTVHLPTSGTYVMLVLDNDGQQTGNYGLHLQRIISPVGAPAIGYGQTLQDTLTVRSQIKAYTFAGVAGEVVTALLAGSWATVPRLELYDPAGGLRKRIDAQSIRADTVHLTGTGTYTLLVLDSDGQQTGNYGLHLQRITDPIGAPLISYGQTLQDTLVVRADINAYTFSGTAGDVITALLAGNWTGVPRLELYDPAGVLRKRLDAQSIRADTLHLASSGIYTLLVLDSDGQQTGNFGLSLQRVNDPGGATLLGYGQTLQDTLRGRATINSYTFSGIAGEVITAFLAGSWSTVPRLELYDPAGNLRKRVDAQTLRVDTLPLTATGTYALLVLDSDGQQTGNYGLHIQRITGPTGAPVITFGQTFQDTLYARAELNAYTFSGAAGEMVTLKASGTGVSGFLPVLEVYSPPGRILRRTPASTDLRVDTLRLPETGMYAVLVLDNDGQQAGNYGFHIQRIVTPGGSRVISYGQTLQDTLYQRGEINAYTFSGAAGEVATLRTFATGLGFSQLELYHADGRLWRRIAGSNSLRMDTLRLPAGGTYTVLMLDDNGQETGNYGLHLQRLMNPVGATAMSYGQVLEDTLYQRTEVNAYTFIGGTYDTVSIRMDATWPNGPQVELYRTDGTLLKRAGGTGIARIDTFKLSSTGVYTILALDNDGQQTGSHTITLTGRTASITTVPCIVSAGWNMLSVPAIVADFSRNGVYPGSIAGAFRYTPGIGYSVHDTLETGTGYWIKFGSAQLVNITGSTILADALDVQAGWNMIGTITRPIPAESVLTIPPGIIIGSFFAYNGSYTSVDTLEPGRGFWVKMSSAGQLLLGSPGTRTVPAIREDSPRRPAREAPPPRDARPDRENAPKRAP
jgi:hypothetical protein